MFLKLLTFVKIQGMFRTTILRSAPCARLVVSGQCRPNSNAPPSKLEVFIDDKKVQVDPGTTVLQVIKN